jgi:hypothetical protein
VAGIVTVPHGVTTIETRQRLRIMWHCIGRSRSDFEKTGGADGTRTRGLLNASQALCQLSYSPTG